MEAGFKFRIAEDFNGLGEFGVLLPSDEEEELKEEEELSLLVESSLEIEETPSPLHEAKVKSDIANNKPNLLFIKNSQKIELNPI